MTTVRSTRKAGVGCRLQFRAAIYFAAFTFFAAGRVFGESATLAWDRASSHTNLSAYILKYGTTSGTYTGSVSVATNVTSGTVNSLVAGQTYYFVAIARDVSGVESDPSNEISYTVPRTGPTTPPIANAASISTPEDQSRAITLTGSDADGDPLTFTIVTQPSNGSLTGTPPNLTYVPAANFFGADSFTFRANDGLSNSLPATISITVTAVNDPPTLNAIASLTLGTNAGPQTVNLSGIGSGAANESQTLTVTATSSNPSLIPNPSVIYSSPSATGSLSFTPAANVGGTATITVTVNDGQSQNNTVTRSFTVTVGTISARTLFVEAESGTQVAPMVAASDANASGGQYVYSQTDEQGSLTLQLSITQASDYVIWCRVLSVDIGTDSFYVSADGGAEDIYVTTPNTWSSAWQWSQLSGQTAGNPRIFTFSQGTHQLVFRGREASTYLDALYITNDRNFVPPSGGPNRPPTLAAISGRTIAEDATLQTVSLTGISSGSVSENQTLTITATSSNPSLIPNPTVSYTSPNATGTLTFTPLPDANGTATITVTVDDGQSISNLISKTFTVTVTAVNDPPTLNALSARTVNEDAGPQTVSLSGIGSGAANESQTLTVTATSSSTSLIPNPSVSYTSPNTTGTLTFQPVANASGTATITVTVNDGQLLNNITTRTFTVTVNAINDAPTISDIANQTINEGNPTAALPFTIGDVESAASTLTLSATSSNPTLVPVANIVFGGSGANRTVTVTPASTQFGSTLITVTVTDPSGGTASDAFTLTVNPVNQAPTLNAINNLTISEDAGQQTVNLAGISTGAANENDTLTVTAASSNTGLIPNPTVNYTSPNATGSLTFSPVADANGTATITVTVNDGQSLSNLVMRAFTVTVVSVNDPPTLNPLSNLSLNEDAGPQTVNLSGISSGAANENQTLTVTASSSNPSLIPNPSVSYVSPNSTGTLIFRSATNATGTAIITVTVNDGQTQNNTVSRPFTVTVLGVNDPPSISDIPDQTINEGSATAALPFTVSDTETPAASLTISASSSNPTLVPVPNIVFGGSGANRTVTVTPVSGLSGSVVVTVLVSDGNGGTATDPFTVNVVAVNQPPTLDPIGDIVLNEDAGQRTVNLAGISTGAFDELQILTVTAISSNPSLIPNPTVNYTSPNFTGTLTFTPAPNANGVATLTVTVNDGQSQNNTVSRTFTVTINAVNDLPTISAIADQSINQNTSTPFISFTIGDIETPATSLTVGASSSNPTLVPNANIALGGSGANRTVRVTPALNQFGSAVITVTVADGSGGVNSDSFVLTVNAVNFTPTLDPLANLTIVEDSGQQTVSLTGITSGSASENQTLTVTAVSGNPGLIPNPAVNYASPNSTGTLAFTPLPDANGTAVITVTVNDGQAQNNLFTRSFTITVNPVNDPPTLSPIANVNLAQNVSSHTVGLSGISAGAANENQTLTVTAASSDPTLVPNPAVSYFSPSTSGSLTLNPVANASGTATITVTVNDGGTQNNIVVRTFTVTVSGGNSAPTITDLPDRTIPMNGIASPINFTIGDAETSADFLRVVATSSNPALVWTNNISINGTGSNRVASVPASHDQYGYSVITFTVYDEQGASSSDSFVLTVVPPNVLPTLDPIASMIIDEDSGPHTVNLTGISAGGTNENQTLIVSAWSSTPGVIPHPTIDYTSPNPSGTLTFTTVSNVIGSATIVVTVNDGQSQDYLITRTFGIIVNGVNDPPTISSIPNQAVEQNTPTGVIPFVIDDLETPLSSLTLSATSSDQTLIPNANIVLGGSQGNRTVTVTPALSRSGTATVTISVSDGLLGASSSFEVTVGSPNTAPIIAAPSSVLGDSYTEADVPVIVSDRESRPEDLTLTAASYNASILPDANISISGSGSNRVVKCRPVPGTSGYVTVDLGVSDGKALTRRSFQLSVQAGHAPRSTISVRRNGRGTVKPELDGQQLTIGQSYTIAAIPAADEVFVHWSGGVTSSVPSLTFVMVSNLVLEVTFTNNPYIAMKGSYNGLFHEAAEIRQQSSGCFVVTPTDRGTYTGKLKLGSRSYSISGALDLGRKGTNTIIRKGTNSIKVELDFGGGSTNQVVGRVTDGAWVSLLMGDRAIFNSRTNPAPYAGNYTMIIPGLDNGADGPEGDGYGTVKVDGNGSVTLAGTLADGTRVTQRVPLSMRGDWPLYVPLYTGGGSVLSWLAFNNRPTDDITGLLSWIKPALVTAKQYPGGFTNESMTVGSSYLRPVTAASPMLSLADMQIAFEGGNLANQFANAITIANNKVTNLSSNKLSLILSTASGLFSGSVTEPATGKVLRFSGAVLQKQNVGSGFLLGTNRSSRVLLGDWSGNN